MYRTVNTLIKPASGMCNMACRYCFYCDEMSKREQESKGLMSEQTLKNVIRKTMLCAGESAHYAFQGGEPTLAGLEFYRNVIKYQKQYNKNAIMVGNSIQTNGYVLDDEWCRFFSENHFLVGISVDGTKKIHDSLRINRNGQDTYERIMDSIQLLEKYKVDYNILTVVSKDVAKNITYIYEAYKRNGWNYQQYIPCLDPLDSPRGENAYSLLPEEYGEFLVTLFQLWYEDVKKGVQPNIRQFENHAGILLGYQPEACDQRGRCSIQNVVEADGSVYPCDFYALDEYLLGNFNSNRLPEILDNAKQSGFERRSELLAEDCKSCEYFSLCRGGCQRNRVLNEQEGAYHNYYCKSYKMFFSQCLEPLKELIDNRQRGVKPR